MLTRFGWAALAGAAAAIATGRVFGLIELYVVGVALVAVTLLAVLSVRSAAPRLDVRRRAEPTAPTAGQPTRVVVSVRRISGRRGTVELLDRVDRVGMASMNIARLGSGEAIQATYAIPSVRRGLLTCGPMSARWTDPLGLAQRSPIVADPYEVVVLPVTVPLETPRVGSAGILGQLLRAKSVAQGGTDFHGLRQYVPGDEPRRISWKASARSEQLLIREHADDELRRVTIVLDAAATADDAFERAVSVTSSVLAACVAADLDVRVVSQDADWRGPDVARGAGRWLALVEPSTAADRVTTESTTPDGLSLLVLVATRRGSPYLADARHHLGRNATVVTVTAGAETSSNPATLELVAPSLEAFATEWDVLVNGGARR